MSGGALDWFISGYDSVAGWSEHSEGANMRTFGSLKLRH